MSTALNATLFAATLDHFNVTVKRLIRQYSITRFLYVEQIPKGVGGPSAEVFTVNSSSNEAVLLELYPPQFSHVVPFPLPSLTRTFN